MGARLVQGRPAGAARRSRKLPTGQAASCQCTQVASRWEGAHQTPRLLLRVGSAHSGNISTRRSGGMLSSTLRSPRHLGAATSRRSGCSGAPAASLFGGSDATRRLWEEKGQALPVPDRKDARSGCLCSKQELNVCHFSCLIMTQEVC